MKNNNYDVSCNSASKPQAWVAVSNNRQKIYGLNEDFLNFCMLFSESASINFSGHLEIYIEDHPFETDLLIEVEDLILSIDSLIPGGWGSDSKVEWSTESMPGPTHVWFKDSDGWEVLVKDHDRGFLGEDEEWDEYHDSSYQDDPGFDDEW